MVQIVVERYEIDALSLDALNVICFYNFASLSSWFDLPPTASNNGSEDPQPHGSRRPCCPLSLEGRQSGNLRSMIQILAGDAAPW
jgi:hypothetical protein